MKLCASAYTHREKSAAQCSKENCLERDIYSVNTVQGEIGESAFADSGRRKSKHAPDQRNLGGQPLHMVAVASHFLAKILSMILWVKRVCVMIDFVRARSVMAERDRE